MNDVKNLLTIAALSIGFGLSASPALAEGVHGVRETATEILIDVPRMCKSVIFEWEGIYERNENNKDAVMSFVQSDNNKFGTLFFKEGHYRFRTTWRGGETIRIPKFDAKGKPIKISLVSIIAYGDDDRAFDTNNWRYESQNGRWVYGATVTPAVRVGFWGQCK